MANQIKSRKLGGIKAAARINPQSNLIFNLLDRLLSTRAPSAPGPTDGARTTQPPSPLRKEKTGPVSTWSREERMSSSLAWR